MKKTLNESSITSELRGQSAFFPRQAPPPSTTQDQPQAEPARSDRQQEHSRHAENVRRNSGTLERSNEQTPQRRKIRHTFDIFHDQLLALRELALQRDMQSGTRTLLGDLVQEALDAFIAAERSNEATNER